MNKQENGENNDTKYEPPIEESLDDLVELEEPDDLDNLEEVDLDDLEDLGDLEDLEEVNLGLVEEDLTDLEELDPDKFFTLDEYYELSEMEAPESGGSVKEENIIRFEEVKAIINEGALQFNIEDIKNLDRATVVSAFDKNKLVTSEDISEQSKLRELLQDITQHFTIIIDKFSQIATHENIDDLVDKIMVFPINVVTKVSNSLNISVSSNFNILANSQSEEARMSAINRVRNRVKEVIDKAIKDSNIEYMNDLYVSNPNIAKTEIISFCEKIYNNYNEDSSLRSSVHAGNIFIDEMDMWAIKLYESYKENFNTKAYPKKLIPYLPSTIIGSAMAATGIDTEDLGTKVKPDVTKVGDWISTLPLEDFTRVIYGSACPESLKIRFALHIEDLIPYNVKSNVRSIMKERLSSRVSARELNSSNEEYVKSLVNVRVSALYDLVPQYSEEVKNAIQILRQTPTAEDYLNNVCSVSSYNALTETCTCGNCGSELPVDGSMLTYIRSGNSSSSSNKDNIRVYTNLSICKNSKCRFINTLPYEVLMRAKNISLDNYADKDKEVGSLVTLNGNVILKLNCNEFGIPVIPVDGVEGEELISNDTVSAEEELALSTLKSNFFVNDDEYIKSSLEFIDRAERLLFRSKIKGNFTNEEIIKGDNIKEVTIEEKTAIGEANVETKSKGFSYETLNLMTKSFCKLNSKDYDTLKSMAVATLLSELNISNSMNTSIDNIAISYTALETINDLFKNPNTDIDKVKEVYASNLTRIKDNTMNLGMLRIRNIKLNNNYMNLLNDSPLRNELLIISELMIINSLLPDTINTLKKYGNINLLGLEFYEKSQVFVRTSEGEDILYNSIITSDTVVGGYLHLLAECIPFLGYIRDYDLDSFKDSFTEFKSSLEEFITGLDNELEKATIAEAQLLNLSIVNNDAKSILELSSELYKSIKKINYGFFGITSIKKFISPEVFDQLTILEEACKDGDISKDIFGEEMSDNEYKIVNEFVKSTGYMSNKILSFPEDKTSDIYTVLDKYNKKESLVPTKEIKLITEYINKVDIELISLSSMFNNLGSYDENLYDCLYNYYKIYNYILHLNYDINSLISMSRAPSDFKSNYIFRPVSDVDVIRDYTMDRYMKEDPNYDYTLSNLFTNMPVEGKLYDSLLVYDYSGEYKFSVGDLNKTLNSELGYTLETIGEYNSNYKVIEDIVGGKYEFNITGK